MNAEFRCHRCGGTPDASTSKTGKAVAPMAEPPVRNAYWEKVMAAACEGCWREWKEMEVKVINEYRLNMLEREHRQMLKKFMHDFLSLDGQGQAAAAPDAVAQNWKPQG